jgi:tRNA threonylcarbamoyladenosine biosynthesis protein TsaE
MRIIVSKSEQETYKEADEFLKSLPKDKNLICLFGDLGSGKTVFVKGLADSLGIGDYSVKSPTYTFIREYPHQKGTLFHIDLYRLDEPDEILFRQIEELYPKKGALIVIEWADKMKDNLPENRVDICFEYVDKKTRKITIF